MLTRELKNCRTVRPHTHILIDLLLMDCFLSCRKLEDLSVDEFLLTGFESDEEPPKQNGLKKKTDQNSPSPKK